MLLAYSDHKTGYLRNVLESFWLARRFLNETVPPLIVHNSDIFRKESRRLEQYLKQRVHEPNRLKRVERRRRTATETFAFRSVVPEQMEPDRHVWTEQDHSDDRSMSENRSPASYASPVMEEKITYSPPQPNEPVFGYLG